MKKLTLLFAFLLLLVVVPVAVGQVTTQEARALEGARLEQLQYEEVRFQNARSGLTLAGLLFLPQGDGPYPAVVIAHGSGNSYRANRWMATLAGYLQQQGIGVLLPDKRGSEQSGGDWRTASFAELATDSAAAAAYLRGRSDLPIQTIGVVGSSQGGHITPLIAATSTDVDFIVDLSGAAVPIRDVLLYEERNNLRQMGFLPGVADLLAYPSVWSITAVRQKTFWDAAGDYDPLPYWRELSVPALVLYGEEDTNVPAARSAAALRGLEKPNITVRVFPGSGHDLEDPPGRGNAMFRDDALQEISAFTWVVNGGM